MRELLPNEAVLQIWSYKDHTGVQMREVAEKVSEFMREHPELGNLNGIEGPTFHIPDYFSELFGSMMGWLIYVTDGDPIELKKAMMELEVNESGRMADIDVFTSYFDKISRKDLGVCKK